mgnify:CR=1 FL=1
MGKLLDLAKALAGEKSLHGLFGRWIQAVSSALDAQGGATPLEYIQVGYTAPQTIAANTDLLPDDTIIVSGITYSPPSGLFRLTGGKKYHLLAHGRFTDFSDDTGGVLNVAWLDNDSSGVLGVVGVFEPHTSTVDACDHPVVEAVIAPTEDVNVKLRCRSATGSAIINAGGFSASIVELR